jgi:hypothetical protein
VDVTAFMVCVVLLQVILDKVVILGRFGEVVPLLSSPTR